MTRKLAFICSRYAGDTDLDVERNVMRARALCRMAVDDGYTPIAPHLLYPQFMSEKTERDLGIEMGLQLLELCDIMFIDAARIISGGMQAEIEYAKAWDAEQRWINE